MPNGDGHISFLKEAFETKERGASWLFRAGLTAALTLATYLTINYLTDLRASVNGLQSIIETKSEASWKAIGEVSKQQSETEKNLGIFTQSVQDSIRAQSDAIDRLVREEDDHERRMRSLEGGRH